MELGELRPATGLKKDAFVGQIVMAPPSAVADRWARRLPDPVVCMASGWMTVRQRAKQRGVELPLVISDHADWDELCQTIDDVGAPEIWVTHGREEALVHHATSRGIRARALAMVGFDEEGQGECPNRLLRADRRRRGNCCEALCRTDRRADLHAVPQRQDPADGRLLQPHARTRSAASRWRP